MSMADLTFLEDAIISVTKELTEIGGTAPPSNQVAKFSRQLIRHTTQDFTEAVENLSGVYGFIEHLNDDTVRLTAQGIQRVGPITPTTSNAESHERIRVLLEPKAIRVFDALADGRWRVLDEVAAEVGYRNVKSKGFTRPLSKMKSLGIIEYQRNATNPQDQGPASIVVQLHDIAFAMGRPFEDAV